MTVGVVGSFVDVMEAAAVRGGCGRRQGLGGCGPDGISSSDGELGGLREWISILLIRKGLIEMWHAIVV